MPCSLGTALAIACCLGALATLAGGGVLLGLSPWWRSWLGPWHVAADIAAMLIAYGVLSGLAVRLLAALLPIRPGSYGPGDAAFARWQLLAVITMFGQWTLRPFAPHLLRPLLARLYGARLGRGVLVGGYIDDPWMLTIGDGAVLGNASLVAGNMQAGGRLVLGRVVIGAGAVIGANAVVMPGCTVGAGAQLQTGAVLVPGTAIGAGETWRGNPARPWKPLAPPPAGEAA